MLLVCLSHIKQHFVDSAPDLYAAPLMTTRIATPTFLFFYGRPRWLVSSIASKTAVIGKASLLSG